MSIIGTLKNQGILQPTQKAGIYGIELNGKPGIQEEEVIPDTNKNGRTDLKEVLDFVVNNVRSMPVIEKVAHVVEGETDEDLRIVKTVRNEYAPKLWDAYRAVRNEAWLKNFEQAQMLLKEFKRLEEEEQKALSMLDTEKAENISKEKDVAGAALSRIGYHPELPNGMIYLPTGEKIPFHSILFSDIKGMVNYISLARSVMVTLPTGEKVQASSLAYDLEGKIKHVNFEKPILVFLPPFGKKMLVRGLEFNDKGQLVGAALMDKVPVTLPRGEKVLARDWIRFNSKGKIINADLAQPAWITLPSGEKALVSSIHYTEQEKLGSVTLSGRSRITLPTGSKEFVKDQIYFNDIGAIDYVTLAESSYLQLPGDRLDAVHAKGTVRFSRGKLSSVELVTPKRLILPTGEEVSVTEIGFSLEGKMNRIKLEKNCSLLLPTGDRASVTDIHYNDDGKIVEVTFEKPMLTTLPTGDKVEAEALKFYPHGGIEHVSITSNNTQVTLPTGDKVFVDHISFNAAGKIARVFTSKMQVLKITEVNFPIIPQSTMYFNDQGKLVGIFPPAIVTPSEFKIDLK